MSALKKAVELDPQNASAHAHLGFVYYTQLNWEAAAENLKKAVDLGVKSEEYYYELGLAYVQLDDCANAVTWLQKALEMNPQSQPARDGLKQCAQGLHIPDLRL